MTIHSNVVQPPTNVPVFQDDGKTLNPVWSLFFTALVSAAGPISPVDVGVSPYEYLASYPGNLLIVGGTVSGLILTRARISVPLPMIDGFIPMVPGDVLETTYSVMPDAWFVPNMGGVGGP